MKKTILALIALMLLAMMATAALAAGEVTYDGTKITYSYDVSGVADVSLDGEYFNSVHGKDTATYTVALEPGLHVLSIGGKHYPFTVEEPVKIETFEFSKNASKTIHVGDQLQIAVTGKTIKTCKSGTAKVATVDNNGLVTAVAVGKSKITVTTTDGKKLTLTLTVDDPTEPTKITLNKSGTVNLDLHETLPVGYTLSPATAVSGVTWKSSSTKVATVDANGVITPVKTGTATITATTAKGKKTAKFKVKIVDMHAPTGVSITAPSTTVFVNGTLELTGVMKGPAGYEPISTLTWKSSATKVLTVESTGETVKVTGKKAGTATVTVTTGNKKSAKLKLTVSDPTVPASVKIDQSDVVINLANDEKTVQLTATATAVAEGYDAVTTYSWSTSDKKVATVSKTGLVTGLKAGTAKITVTTANKKTATVTVKVVK